MRTDLERVQDMLDVIALLQAHRDRGRAAFESDVVFNSFVLHQLQVLGEAAYRLSQSVRANSPAIPWRQINSTCGPA